MPHVGGDKKLSLPVVLILYKGLQNGGPMAAIIDGFLCIQVGQGCPSLIKMAEVITNCTSTDELPRLLMRGVPSFQTKIQGWVHS